jgi:hypothetical protein
MFKVHQNHVLVSLVNVLVNKVNNKLVVLLVVVVVAVVVEVVEDVVVPLVPLLLVMPQLPNKQFIPFCLLLIITIPTPTLYHDFYTIYMITTIYPIHSYLV